MATNLLNFLMYGYLKVPIIIKLDSQTAGEIFCHTRSLEVFIFKGEKDENINSES